MIYQKNIWPVIERSQWRGTRLAPIAASIHPATLISRISPWIIIKTKEIEKGIILGSFWWEYIFCLIKPTSQLPNFGTIQHFLELLLFPLPSVRYISMIRFCVPELVQECVEHLFIYSNGIHGYGKLLGFC